jgi:hypothetical protein
VTAFMASRRVRGAGSSNDGGRSPVRFEKWMTLDLLNELVQLNGGLINVEEFSRSRWSRVGGIIFKGNGKPT